jgi:hypothetical protein
LRKVKNLLGGELKVINIGLELFHTSLIDQNVTCIHVEWKPRAKLDPKLEQILSKIL